MQVLWFEDLLALAQTRSMRGAAELRHVTHPAFGRRIKALEAWAGMPLIDRTARPLRLTSAGESLLVQARQTLQDIAQTREAMRLEAGLDDAIVSLVTGRTLARTIVADWLPRILPLFDKGMFRIQTRALGETVQMLEADQVQFMLTYFHPSLGLKLSARQFEFLRVAEDELVPVSSCTIQGKPRHKLENGLLLSYARPLALRQLVDDHLRALQDAPRLSSRLECDSADAMLEFAIKGAGVAWLPSDMVASACRRKQLVVLGGKVLRIPLEIRLYRRKRKLSAQAEKVWQVLQKSTNW